MKTLRFKRKEVMEMLSKVNRSGICLVGDQGVYLMNWGKDRTICYAKGYNPNTEDFDDWYDKKHALSADDFGEDLTIDMFQDFIKRSTPTSDLYIKMSKTNLFITYYALKNVKRVLIEIDGEKHWITEKKLKAWKKKNPDHLHLLTVLERKG